MIEPGTWSAFVIMQVCVDCEWKQFDGITNYCWKYLQLCEHDTYVWEFLSV